MVYHDCCTSNCYFYFQRSLKLLLHGHETTLLYPNYSLPWQVSLIYWGMIFRDVQCCYNASSAYGHLTSTKASWGSFVFSDFALFLVRNLPYLHVGSSPNFLPYFYAHRDTALLTCTFHLNHSQLFLAEKSQDRVSK